jgi:hypothetical protein
VKDRVERFVYGIKFRDPEANSIRISSSVLRHFKLIRELKSGTWVPGQVSRDGVGLGLLLAGAGIGMCIYLTRIRSSLGRDTFLKVAIADEDVHVVVHDSVARTVESRCERNLGNGHADPVGKALAQWSCGRLDAWGLPYSGCPGVRLPH